MNGYMFSLRTFHHLFVGIAPEAYVVFLADFQAEILPATKRPLIVVLGERYCSLSVERTKVWVELWILACDVASDTHEMVKHMITLENTFDWYNTESNLRRLYMYVSIALAS